MILVIMSTIFINATHSKRGLTNMFNVSMSLLIFCFYLPINVMGSRCELHDPNDSYIKRTNSSYDICKNYSSNFEITKKMKFHEGPIYILMMRY